MISTKYRSTAAEIMDDFDMKGEILQDALDKIAIINRLLGGNKLTLQGVKSLLKNSNKTTAITIVDIGCGNGDMLREIAKFGYENGYNFKLVGIDANQFTINYATNISVKYKNIQYICLDIFSEAFVELKYDIVLCTLTLHHFKNEDIISLMRRFYMNSNIGIVINDLHRSKLAYYLFQMVAIVFGLNKMSKQDGLVSILRGFKRKDLVQYATALSIRSYKIQWKWAFRYQWIINKQTL